MLHILLLQMLLLVSVSDGLQFLCDNSDNTGDGTMALLSQAVQV